MKDLLIVGLGGFLGTISRYGVFILSAKYVSDKSYPGTLLVNLIGCFLVGILAGGILKNHQHLSLFLIIGFCGSFTTFSTFSADGLKMLREGLSLEFALYTLISLAGGMLLCFLGMQISEKL
jgi:Integral membrane protein possibly involved in chromosome condensation